MMGDGRLFAIGQVRPREALNPDATRRPLPDFHGLSGNAATVNVGTADHRRDPV